MIVVIILSWLILCGLCLFIPSTIEIEEYTKHDKDEVVWVSRNLDFNKVVTFFFPHIALMYECLCEKINGEGLAILIILVLLLTLPMTILMGVLAFIYFMCLKVWQLFCTTFARESDDE